MARLCVVLLRLRVGVRVRMRMAPLTVAVTRRCRSSLLHHQLLLHGVRLQLQLRHTAALPLRLRRRCALSIVVAPRRLERRRGGVKRALPGGVVLRQWRGRISAPTAAPLLQLRRALPPIATATTAAPRRSTRSVSRASGGERGSCSEAGVDTAQVIVGDSELYRPACALHFAPLAVPADGWEEPVAGNLLPAI